MLQKYVNFVYNFHPANHYSQYPNFVEKSINARNILNLSFMVFISALRLNFMPQFMGRNEKWVKKTLFYNILLSSFLLSNFNASSHILMAVKCALLKILVCSFLL